jgi:hypothetical protein
VVRKAAVDDLLGLQVGRRYPDVKERLI